jgi:hypothetical protein
VGDCVYVLGEGFDQEGMISDEEDEACEVCGSDHLDVDMLECSKCLRGFHLNCLRPKLKAVPKVRQAGSTVCCLPQLLVLGSHALACVGTCRMQRCLSCCSHSDMCMLLLHELACPTACTLLLQCA